jgi:hypothetical protein
VALPAPVRVYLVVNARTITRRTVRFRTDAPAGAIGTIVINGQRKRVHLLDYLVDDTRGGRAYAAELLDVYL